MKRSAPTLIHTAGSFDVSRTIDAAGNTTPRRRPDSDATSVTGWPIASDGARRACGGMCPESERQHAIAQAAPDAHQFQRHARLILERRGLDPHCGTDVGGRRLDHQRGRLHDLEQDIPVFHDLTRDDAYAGDDAGDRRAQHFARFQACANHANAIAQALPLGPRHFDVLARDGALERFEAAGALRGHLFAGLEFGKSASCSARA